MLAKIRNWFKNRAFVIGNLLATVALCIIFRRIYTYYPDVIFTGNTILLLAILYLLCHMAFYGKDNVHVLKVLCCIAVVICANRLYNYSTLLDLVPQIGRVSEIQLYLFSAGIVVFVPLILRIVVLLHKHIERSQLEHNGNIYHNESVTDINKQSENKEGQTGEDNLVHGTMTIESSESPENSQDFEDSGKIHEHYHENERRSIGAYLLVAFQVVISIAAVIAPYFILYRFNSMGIALEALEFDSLLSFVVSYALSGLLIVVILVIQIYIVVYALRYLWSLFRSLFKDVIGRKKSGTEMSQDNVESFPTYAFSAVITCILMYFAWRTMDYGIDGLMDKLAAADYLALPLTVILAVALFLLVTVIVQTIFLLIMSMTSQKIKDYLNRVNRKTNILDMAIHIVVLVVHIILGTAEAILGMVDFVPHFFTALKGLVIGDDESDKSSDEQKKLSASEQGIRIIRVAAFCLALVSWMATAYGLNQFVFAESGYIQAYLISFGIQAFLFVFNMQLPQHLTKIGANIKESKKRFSGVAASICKAFFISFYVVVLLSSSWFSFVYISVTVLADTRYEESNLVLDSTYRTYLRDLESYVDEGTQVSLLNISSILGELQPMLSTADTSVTESYEELNEAVNTAQTDYDNAVAILNAAQDNYDMALVVYTEAQETQYWKPDEYALAEENWQEAYSELQEALANQTAANSALTEAKNKLAAYVEPTDSIVNELLAEILNSSPNEETISELLESLNSKVADSESVLAGNGRTESGYSYADLVATTQELTIAVNNYLDLRAILTSSGEMNDLGDLQALLQEDTIVVAPASDDEGSVQLWTETWEENFQVLKGLIQSLPDFSDDTLAEIKSTYESVEVASLQNFTKDAYVSSIDKLIRNHLSDINDVERAWNSLFSDSPFMSWFSLILALFFDVSSLLAGIFIYYLSKDSAEQEEYEQTAHDI